MEVTPDSLSACRFFKFDFVLFQIFKINLYEEVYIWNMIPTLNNPYSAFFISLLSP